MVNDRPFTPFFRHNFPQTKTFVQKFVSFKNLAKLVVLALYDHNTRRARKYVPSYLLALKAFSSSGWIVCQPRSKSRTHNDVVFRTRRSTSVTYKGYESTTAYTIQLPSTLVDLCTIGAKLSTPMRVSPPLPLPNPGESVFFPLYAYAPTTTPPPTVASAFSLALKHSVHSTWLAVPQLHHAQI